MTAETAPAPVGQTGADGCGEQLRQLFPALFAGAPKPLKLRIQADIQARAPGVFGKAALTAFLRQHTGRTAYLLALTRAEHRFDLDGAPAGELSAEHRQAALDELARRRSLRQTREAEWEAQRRARAELLRAYENSPLSEANFCALKGVAPQDLPQLLDLARREAVERRERVGRVERVERRSWPAHAPQRRPPPRR